MVPLLHSACVTFRQLENGARSRSVVPKYGLAAHAHAGTGSHTAQAGSGPQVRCSRLTGRGGDSDCCTLAPRDSTSSSMVLVTTVNLIVRFRHVNRTCRTNFDRGPARSSWCRRVRQTSEGSKAQRAKRALGSRDRRRALARAHSTRILRSYRYPRAATRAQWRCRAAQAGWRAGPQGALAVLRGWDLLSSPVLQPTAPLRLLRMGEAQRLLRATSRQPQPAAALPAGCGVALVGRVR